MGIYINKGNAAFRQYTNGEYVDKTDLIAYVNSTVDTADKLTCVSRPRRFGKSMAAQMIYAYYDKSCDSRELFSRFKISQDESFERCLNKYPAIYIDITGFISREDKNNIADHIQAAVVKDVLEAYPVIKPEEDRDLMDVLLTVSMATGEKFVMIIDEWDALFREIPDKPTEINDYINLLQRLFKGSDTATTFALVYMTGSLPIAKYNVRAAISDFRDYSIMSSDELNAFLGFTNEEVQQLAEKYSMDAKELTQWYGGYAIGHQKDMFNPGSVMRALGQEWCNSYWWGTKSIHDLDDSFRTNFDGINDVLIKLFNGLHVETANIRLNRHVWREFTSKEDLLSALIHLGYLTYNCESYECFVPNKEVLGRLSTHIQGLKI